MEYYTASGPVRGECPHRHRTVGAARRCAATDQRGCARAGGYSDRTVHSGSCRQVRQAGAPCTCRVHGA